LRAALAELDVPPAPGPERRARFERLYDRIGGERAHALLSERDPAAAARLHPNDRRRIVRALELTELGASLPSAQRLWSEDARHPTIIFGLVLPHDVLAARIDARARAMFDAGVEAEVHAALAAGPSATVIHALGLREIAELPRAQAIDEMNAAMRKYAAYQRK
jgi:tRNA dimethylallyltransferase